MSADFPLGILIGILALLLLCSAFFSGTETALMSLNRYRLRHLARKGHRGARLAERLLKRPDRLIGVILFGNNLVNFLAASLVTVVALRLGGPAAVAGGTFMLTFVVLIFAEVTPKTLAALYPERVGLPATFVYFALLKISFPLIWLINIISNGILRIFGVRAEDGFQEQLTLDELRAAVSDSRARLPRKRQEMLMGILHLDDMTVDDIMVPHNEITGIDLTEPWSDVLATIRESEYTRLPVFEDSVDNLVGILHMRRLVQADSLDALDANALLELVNDPYFIPEGTTLNKQLVQFQRMRQRTALVVDEYGDIQGMVTLEDLLEEIVGEFTSDPAPAHADVRADNESRSWVVNASANVRALNRMMNWRLPTSGPKTLNGLILEELEHIPEKGTDFKLNQYPVEILETNDNAVRTVRIFPPDVTTGDAA